MNSQIEGVSSAADLWSKFVQYRIAHTQSQFYRGQPDDLLQACQKIDDELAAMRLAMSSLLMHRNTLAPISSLPPEILTRIFRFNMVDWQPPPRWKDQPDKMGWIRVTHVCKFWREIVLHDPAMWNDLTTNLGPRWLELMVERAKSMPLSYNQVSCDEDSGKFLAHVLPHLLFRIRSLSVSDTPNAFFDLSPLLKSPAPTLHTVELVATDTYRHRITLSKGAFQGESPMLRRLHLDSVCVSWAAPFLRGLTYLHIEQEKYHASPQTTHEDDFFHALEAMPALETLYLASVLPTNLSETSAGDRTVGLPCLQTLTLIDEGPRCLRVLKQLDIPPSCRVHLECVDHNNPRLEASLLPLCDQFPARADSFHTLSIVYTDEHTIGLKLWRASSVSGSEVFHPAQDPDLFMSVFIIWGDEEDDEDDEDPNPEPTEVMCDALPLSEVRVVRVVVKECNLLVSSCMGWQCFSRNCRKINTIILDRDSDVRDLCEAILEDEAAREGGQQTDSTQREPFLPNLKVLELDAMDLRPFKTRKGTKIEIGKALVSALAGRRERGRAVSTVRLGKRCIIDASRLKALRDVVYVEYDPSSIQQIPKAPAGRAKGFVYTDREIWDPQSSRWR